MEYILNPWPWYVTGPLIALVMLMLLYFGKTFAMSSNLATINTSELEDMMLERNVESVVLIKNMELVEVTLNSDGLNNAKYTCSHSV